MKHGKKPTYAQRKMIEKWGLDSHDWLVVKDTPGAMTVVHRDNDKTTRTITKGVGV